MSKHWDNNIIGNNVINKEISTENFNKAFDLLWEMNDKEAIRKVLQYCSAESLIIEIANDRKYIRNTKLELILNK